MHENRKSRKISPERVTLLKSQDALLFSHPGCRSSWLPVPCLKLTITPSDTTLVLEIPLVSLIYWLRLKREGEFRQCREGSCWQKKCPIGFVSLAFSEKNKSQFLHKFRRAKGARPEKSQCESRPKRGREWTHQHCMRLLRYNGTSAFITSNSTSL